MKIAVFGGTFDPPHKGHINLARSVVEGYHADRVLFVPSPNPPHKLHKKVSPFEHRLAMLKLAMDDNSLFDYSDMEQRRLPEPSFTIKTMAELSGLYPNDELFWLIGGDSLLNLHSWYKSKELVRDYNLMIYPRPGEVITYDQLSRHWNADDSRKLYESILDLPVFDIASTNIRQAINSGQDVSNFISSEVIDYIRELKLYE